MILHVRHFEQHRPLGLFLGCVLACTVSRFNDALTKECFLGYKSMMHHLICMAMWMLWHLSQLGGAVFCTFAVIYNATAVVA